MAGRAGRDGLLVSPAKLFPYERRNDAQVKKTRREVPFEDYDNVYKNLPAFIEYVFTRPHSPSFSWTDFVHRWHSLDDVVHARHENLHRDAQASYGGVVRKLTGNKLDGEEAGARANEFSFERQSGRRSGEEDKKSLLRKGVVGDWKERFSPEAREVFDRHAGCELVLLDYEQDHGWVKGGKEDVAGGREG